MWRVTAPNPSLFKGVSCTSSFTSNLQMRKLRHRGFKGYDDSSWHLMSAHYLLDTF